MQEEAGYKNHPVPRLCWLISKETVKRPFQKQKESLDRIRILSTLNLSISHGLRNEFYLSSDWA